MHDERDSLRTALREYATRWPDEADMADTFGHFLDSAADVFRRSHLAGHFTGSAWLVSADGKRTLLTLHRKLERWLQPGGHADGDADLARVALREAREETGLRGLQVVAGIFDIDRHRIPARPGEPEHWHYDVRHVVRAGADERYVVSSESRDLAWRAVTEIAIDATMDPSLRRMAHKWLARM